MSKLGGEGEKGGKGGNRKCWGRWDEYAQNTLCAILKEIIKLLKMTNHSFQVKTKYFGGLELNAL